MFLREGLDSSRETNVEMICPSGIEREVAARLQDGWSEAIPIITWREAMGFASLYPSYEPRRLTTRNSMPLES